MANVFDQFDVPPAAGLAARNAIPLAAMAGYAETTSPNGQASS
jgi:hypothetical protein